MYYSNRLDVSKLIREIREKFPEKTIWLYTGFLWETIDSLEVMKDIDVLVDGEFEVEKKDAKLHWRGSSNQRVIDVPASRAAGKIILHCQ